MLELLHVQQWNVLQLCLFFLSEDDQNFDPFIGTGWPANRSLRTVIFTPVQSAYSVSFQILAQAYWSALFYTPTPPVVIWSDANRVRSL